MWGNFYRGVSVKTLVEKFFSSHIKWSNCVTCQCRINYCDVWPHYRHTHWPHTYKGYKILKNLYCHIQHSREMSTVSKFAKRVKQPRFWILLLAQIALQVSSINILMIQLHGKVCRQDGDEIKRLFMYKFNNSIIQ